MAIETTSLYCEELNLSLLAPIHWAQTKNELFPLILLAEVQDDYRANLCFSYTVVDSPSTAVMRAAIAQTKKGQAQDYQDFQELETREFWVDACPAYLQTVHWRLDESEMAQIFSLIMLPNGKMIDIHGVSLRDFEDDYLPIFIDIIESIRIIQK